MKAKTKLLAMALILAATSLTSCTQTPREMLTGTFKIANITTDQKMTPEVAEFWNQQMEELKKNTVLILNADGSMQETTNGVTEKGTWEVIGEEGEEGEIIVLKIIREHKNTINMKLIELSRSGFIYEEPDNNTQTTTVITYTKN